MHHEKNRLRLIEALYPFFAAAAAAISFNCCWIPRKLHGVSNWFQIDTIYASPFSLVPSYRVFMVLLEVKKRVYVIWELTRWEGVWEGASVEVGRSVVGPSDQGHGWDLGGQWAQWVWQGSSQAFGESAIGAPSVLALVSLDGGRQIVWVGQVPLVALVGV